MAGRADVCQLESGDFQFMAVFSCESLFTANNNIQRALRFSKMAKRTEKAFFTRFTMRKS